MKNYTKAIITKFNFWNFFIGFVFGILLTSFAWNIAMPNTTEMVRKFRIESDYDKMQNELQLYSIKASSSNSVIKKVIK